MIKMRNIKGQEEMVGFVLIMVIVAVVFLIFLGIFIRRGAPTEVNDARDLSQFLDSIMEYTTECAVQPEPAFATVADLARYCRAGDLCSNSNKSACEVLKSVLGGALDASEDVLNVGEDRPYNGYILNISYYQNSSSGMMREEIVSQSYGNCSKRYKGSREYIIPADLGTITSSFRVCYDKL